MGFGFARVRIKGIRISEGLLYIYVYKKIVIERTRDLIYLKFVTTDLFLKIISPSAGENSDDLV